MDKEEVGGTPSWVTCSFCGKQLISPNLLCECWRTRQPILSLPIAKGWECPRCHVIHAPWVASCNCHAPVNTNEKRRYNL